MSIYDEVKNYMSSIFFQPKCTLKYNENNNKYIYECTIPSSIEKDKIKSHVEVNPRVVVEYNKKYDNQSCCKDGLFYKENVYYKFFKTHNLPNNIDPNSMKTYFENGKFKMEFEKI